MGISGLLPALQSITATRSLVDYRDKTIAIDGYCWCDAKCLRFVV